MAITSAVPNEGKTTLAVNLAIALAQAGRKVVLVETDLRRPKASTYLGVESELGLTDVLAGQKTLDEALVSWNRGLLTFLPSGHTPPNPSELLASHQFAHVLATLREQYDWVIIATPPPVTDGAIVSKAADGAILVVRFGKTTRETSVHRWRRSSRSTPVCWVRPSTSSHEDGGATATSTGTGTGTDSSSSKELHRPMNVEAERLMLFLDDAYPRLAGAVVVAGSGSADATRSRTPGSPNDPRRRLSAWVSRARALVTPVLRWRFSLLTIWSERATCRVSHPEVANALGFDVSESLSRRSALSFH